MIVLPRTKTREVYPMSLYKNWYDRVTGEMMKFDAEVVVEEDDGGRIVTVKSYLALVALFGYLKHRSHEVVLMRGQTACYGSLTASFYRKSACIVDPPLNVEQWSDGFLEEMHADLDLLLDMLRNDMHVDEKPHQRVSTEPLFQHYGLRTRWLDLVDSIPHALYFALHGISIDGQTLQVVPENGGDAGSREWGYLYFVGCSQSRMLEPVRVLEDGHVIPCKGIWRTADGFKMCDLRQAKPSKALRPHSQHGYLCRPPDTHYDLWHDRMLLRARVPRNAALSWIGGTFFSYENMFPGAEQDRNYRELLKGNVQSTIHLWKNLATRRLSPGGILRYHGE